MARIYQPLEILGDTGQKAGLFRMTVSSDEEGWTHGICGCVGRYEDCPGHASMDEAEKAWRKTHLADIRFHKNTEEQKKCQVCGEWTQNVALLWLDPFSTTFRLCDEHNNKGEIEKLYIK